MTVWIEDTFLKISLNLNKNYSIYLWNYQVKNWKEKESPSLNQKNSLYKNKKYKVTKEMANQRLKLKNNNKNSNLQANNNQNNNNPKLNNKLSKAKAQKSNLHIHNQ